MPDGLPVRRHLLARRASPQPVDTAKAVVRSVAVGGETAMTVNPPVPPPFTSDDFAARMRRVVNSAAENGLVGVIVMPGPDLTWLTGYRPTAITERLTMLVLSRDCEPTLLVPI